MIKDTTQLTNNVDNNDDFTKNEQQQRFRPIFFIAVAILSV